MTMTATERFDSRIVSETADGMINMDISLLCTEPDPLLCRLYLQTTPVKYSGSGSLYKIGDTWPDFSPALYINKIDIKPVDDRRCLADVHFITRPEEKWEFDLTSAEQNITHVTRLGAQGSWPAEAATTAIGIDGETVEGVDVFRPTLSLKVTKSISAGNLDAAINTLVPLIASTNRGDWAIFEQGQALFTGAIIREGQAADYLVEYNFQIAATRTLDPVTLSNGDIVAPNCEPWDYVWFQHDITTDSGGTVAEYTIKSLHIARVYDLAYFSALNLTWPY